MLLAHSAPSPRRTAPPPCAISKATNSASGASTRQSNDLPWGHIEGDPVKAGQSFITHDGPLVKDGRILIPDKPGLGVEPNPDYVRAHLAPGETWWG